MKRKANRDVVCVKLKQNPQKKEVNLIFKFKYLVKRTQKKYEYNKESKTNKLTKSSIFPNNYLI